MRRAHLLPILLLCLTPPVHAGDQGKARKARLEVRATPRMAFSPVKVLLTAELMGGEVAEDFYCPEVEWDWDDGAKSARGQDCPPFEPRMEMERRFTAAHAYRRAGTYTVKITMKRSNKALAVATTTVHVRAGVGDGAGLN